MQMIPKISVEKPFRSISWWPTSTGRTGQPNFDVPFENPVHCPTSLQQIFIYELEFGKGLKNRKNHSSWLVRFDLKMSFHLFCVYHWSLTDRSRIMESTPDFNNLQLFSKSLVTYVQQALISIKKIAKIAKRQRKFKSLHFFIPKGHTVPIEHLYVPGHSHLDFCPAAKHL